MSYALISVVVPVFNSKNILPILVERIHKSISLISENYEVILVDDMSQDNSWMIIQQLANDSNKIKGIRLAKNIGLFFSTSVGINYCSGKFIITIDDDLEYVPEDFKVLYQTIANSPFDIVYGIAELKYQRQGINEKWALFRNQILNLIWNKPTTDSYRIFKKAMLEQGNGFDNNANIDVFVKNHLSSNQIGYCKVQFNQRFEGHSNVSQIKKIKLFVNYSFYFMHIPMIFLIFEASLFCLLIIFQMNCSFDNNIIPGVVLVLILVFLWFLVLYFHIKKRALGTMQYLENTVIELINFN